ncbi:MAG: DEAD/DEAH box helicase, partial [Myxococcales bacterium]|nr:DEAD/DEAH box helicase [Myxococcales bacterium]
MNPFLVADELTRAVRDYLHTTMGFADPAMDQALASLATCDEGGMFRGPYVEVRLPYRSVGEDWENPLEITPSFPPYAHQLAAWQRLSSRQDGPARPTLVTTGTGSGKSECFLYPVLDHCRRHRHTQGVMALVLYPMNALASDQARRLAEMIHTDPALRGNVSAGMYVGGPKDFQGSPVMTPTGVITDRHALRQHPPHILLTNYKMLDFLLLRREDHDLWATNSPDTLQFVVLDEFHTYDGAQGTDVACLLRRLRVRLGAEQGSLACVGTSATLGGGSAEASALRLRGFAEKLFGETFPAESVITEIRQELAELPPPPATAVTAFPEIGPELQPLAGESAASHAARQAILWFPTLSTGKPQAALDRVALGAALLAHPLTLEVLSRCAGAPTLLCDLHRALAPHHPRDPELSEQDRRLLLLSFLSLLTWARRPGSRPLVQCLAQLVVRELSRLARSATATPDLFWRDDRPRDEVPRALVPVYCRTCGADAWMASQRPEDRDEPLDDDFQAIYASFTRASGHTLYLHPGAPPGEQLELYRNYLDPRSLRVVPEPPEGVDAPKVYKHRE